MTRSDPTPPPEQPEEEGIPDYAADTSTAYGDADRPRFDDSPPSLPADQPQAVDELWGSGQEAGRGEPLDDRLAREEPDVDAGSAAASPGPRLADEVVSEQAETQAARDAEVLGTEPEPQPQAGVSSVYDEPEAGSQVGRLVEPDEGVRTDTERDLIADDQGEAGGGPTAEEAAIHEIPPDPSGRS